MEKKKLLIKNAKAIVSCDEKNHVYLNSDMLIEGEKILEIGHNIVCEDAEVLDASDKFVYPGLVNTHHHFFQTFVRNLITIDYPNMHVVEWLDKIYQIFQKIDSDVIYYSSLTAMADLVKHGCTTAFDHQYCLTVHTKKEPVDRQMEAAAQIGIRYHAGRGTNTLPRSEGSTMPDDMLETTEEFIADTRRLIDKYYCTDPFSMRQIVIAPCQPVNCYKDTFIESVKLAKETGARLHTHLGEGENEIMINRWGIRTVDWLKEVGFLGENTWFAHCWELTDEEYRILGAHGAGISHCPSPAILGGFPILPMKSLNDYGVTLSIGCDGSATNDGSNLLDSIRTAYLMQCYNSKARGGGIGSRIFKEYFKENDRMIFLEVEHPNEEDAKRRIKFYKNLGFHLNQYEYYQPPLRPGMPELPLYVMTYPDPIDEEQFEYCKSVLMDTVYHKSLKP